MILLCYCIEIFYMWSLYWRYGPCILAPLHSMGLCRTHAVAGVERLGFNLLRANSCSCLLIHLFFLARNSSEKQEACQKWNHPFREAPAICRVEVSKAKRCLFCIMWASGTVPKPCWGSSVKKKTTLDTVHLPEQMYLRGMIATAILVDTLGITLDISSMSSRAWTKDERLLCHIPQQVHTLGAAHISVSTIPISCKVPSFFPSAWNWACWTTWQETHLAHWTTEQKREQCK